MNNIITNFDIGAFSSLPNDLKNNDYIDILLLLIRLKPNIRLGKNDISTYDKMKKWCHANGFRYLISSSGYMYISRLSISTRITQIVDDSLYEHSELLGMLLGYPKCCRKRIKKVGEQGIDDYEKKLCAKGFKSPYHLINSSSYTKGYALISHVPCCNTCEKSLRIAKKALMVIKRYKKYPCMKRWAMYFNEN